MRQGRTAVAMAGLVALVVAFGMTSSTTTAADTAGKWLHVRVVQEGATSETVKVNLPIAVLETMADSIQAEHFKEGQVRLGETGLKAEQLRAVWQSVKNSRDMDFVTMESDDGHVRVAKSGRHLIVKIDDRAQDRDGIVDVKVPIEVVDALLDAPDGQLNVKAAIQALVEFGKGDLVQVRDGTSRVRIWIDDSNGSDV